MSTSAQRLAWQEQEDTGGLYADPSPEELDELRDDEFRHFDQFVFAQAPALTGRWEKDTRERPAAISSSSGGGAALTRHTTRNNRIPTAGCAGSEVGGPIRPPGAPGLASSVERWMWTA